MDKIKRFIENIKLIRKEDSKLNRYILNVAIAISFIIPTLLVWLLYWLTSESADTNTAKAMYAILYVIVYIAGTCYFLWRTYRNTEALRKNIENRRQKPTSKKYMTQKQKDDLNKQRQVQKLKKQKRTHKKK